MTTVENVTYASALEAASAAGVGGRIKSAITGFTYVVSVDSSVVDPFILTREGDDESRISVTEFVDQENNYSVLEIGDLELKDETVEQVRTFFEGMRRYTYFKIDNIEMLFYGWEYEDGGNTRYAIAFDSQYGDRQDFRSPFLDLPNGTPHHIYKVVENEDGNPKRAEHFTQHMIRSRMETETRLKRATTARDELSVKYHEASSDLIVLNKKINEYAEETHMCGDYEKRIFSWNKELKFQLAGRPRTYYVRLNIPELSDGPIDLPVENSTSPEQAKRIVSEWSKDELLQAIAASNVSHCLSKLTFQVDDSYEPYC